MSPAARGLAALVRLYRWGLSPLLPPSCRFTPSCSAYALEALQVHGAGRGSWLALLRVLRCQPFSPGGVDPVPPRRVRGSVRRAPRPACGDTGDGSAPGPAGSPPSSAAPSSWSAPCSM